MAKVSTVPSAVLAGIVIAGKQKGVGDLPAQTSGNVDIADQPNHDWCHEFGGFRPERTILVHFQSFRLAIDHEAEGPADRYDRQRLERRV